MAFFPIANTSKALGYTTLHNFPTNNWEPIVNIKKSVWAIYSDGIKWITIELDNLEIGDSKTYYYDDIIKKQNKKVNPLILLQFRKTSLPGKLKTLPKHEFIYNSTPEWRATVGFSLNQAQTSYQGEINPFPPMATLLTFHPFIQYNETENHFLFFNLESDPKFREAYIEIYEANSKKFINKIKVISNSCTRIPLDKYCFKKEDLPVFICRSMGGIPFGFGVSTKADMLSLEHTHPPASFAVHGERFTVQSEIKRRWLTKLKP